MFLSASRKVCFQGIRIISIPTSHFLLFTTIVCLLFHLLLILRVFRLVQLESAYHPFIFWRRFELQFPICNLPQGAIIILLQLKVLTLPKENLPNLCPGFYGLFAKRAVESCERTITPPKQLQFECELFPRSFVIICQTQKPDT